MEDTNQTTFANTTSDYVPYELRPETYIVPIVFAIIFIIGFVGNGTLILIFCLHKKMRNVPNTYIFSLAIGDLLVILTSVPFTSTIYTLDSWPYGTVICKISETTKDISIGVSVFTLTALSGDRFFAIVDPMQRLNTKAGTKATRYTILVVLGIWTLSIILSLPAAVFSHSREMGSSGHKFNVCYPFATHTDIYGNETLYWYQRFIVTSKFVVYYAIPLLIIGIFYVLMARHLVLSTRNLPGESSRQVRARKKVAKMVLAFVVIFALCFLPHHTFSLWFYYFSDQGRYYNAFWHVLRIIGFSLSYINSCINPVALVCVSGTFRKHFESYLVKCDRHGLSRTDSFYSASTRRSGTIKTSLRNTNSVCLKNFHSTKTGHLLPEVTITTFMNGGSES